MPTSALAHAPLLVQVLPPAPEVPVDGLRTYLVQVARYRLLTAEEEVLFGGQVQVGHLPDASPECRAAGRDAHARLVQANLRLVVSLARRHAASGVPFGDLVQEGNIGLMRAADGFDPSLGCKFSTYATWWVRQALGRAVADHSRLIRVPSALVEERGRLVRLRAELWSLAGAEPDMPTLARLTGHSEERVRMLLHLRHDAMSLDDPVPGGTAGGPLTCGETALDPDPGPDEQAAAAELTATMALELLRLEPRDRTLLEMRYGLAGREVATVGETARALGLSRDRCRTLEAELLDRLRARSGQSRLHDFLLP